jgi:hypothetical protein
VLPGTVRWPDAIVRRHPLDAARYDLIFRLRFNWHMSLPRIVPFSTALATRRVGPCRHFVYLYSIGTILGGRTIYVLTRPEVSSEFTQPI